MAVEVHTSTIYEDLAAQDFDVAIRMGRGDGGVPGELLLPIHLLPVWNPAYLARLLTPADIKRHPLLGPDHSHEFWQEWLRSYGLETQQARIRQVESILLYEHVLNGGGVTIGIEPLVSHLIRLDNLKG